ncbi:MAG: hypothetical protein OXD29_04420 [Roseovarius sp.]|nr:hypothetical protein [Roseovarius sp.]MCY4315032.1 hypothetical protein [Roseovarius sp.]
MEEWRSLLETGRKVERALAINAVIVWQVAFMTELGRTHPAMAADVAFSDIEMAILTDFAKA